MQLIGLTGGIASGKSTVSDILRELHADVIDADAVYHDLIIPVEGKPSILARRIAESFSGILRADGSIDRQALGQHVFADSDARRLLGSITHPAVAAEVQRRAAALEKEGCATAFYDVPLLFENGLAAGFAGTVVVWVPPSVQVARLMARNGITAAEAEERLAAQLPIDEKRRQATWVIDNSGSIENTREQVERLWRDLFGRTPRAPNRLKPG